MKNLKIKISDKVQSDNFFHYDHIGKREYMEDRSIIYKDEIIQFYAVMDGHGGSNIVEFVHEQLFNFIKNHKFKKLKQQYVKQQIQRQEAINAIKNIFKEFHKNIYLKVDQKFKNKDSSGTTLIYFIQLGDINLVQNIGDSVLYKFSKKKGFIMLNKQNTIEQRDEEKIKQNGGWVQDNRVCGKLQMSRSIGDLDVQKYMEYKFTTRVEKQKKKQQLFVICSDGLSDIFEYNQKLKEKCWIGLCQILQQDCTIKKISQYVKDQIQNQIDDNITFIVFYC